MENNKVTSKIHRGEIWTIAVLVTIFTWLVVFTLVTAFWDQLCVRIAITALEYGAEQMVSRHVFDGPGDPAGFERRDYRSIPPMQDRRRAELEQAVAELGGRAPGETLEEALARLEREALAVDFWWENTSDANE